MNTEGLDPQVLVVLHKITSKGLSELTEDDKGFLRARVMYLDEYEKERFAEVLTDASSEPEPTNAELRAELVALGEDEKSLKKLNHDALKALLVEKEAK